MGDLRCVAALKGFSSGTEIEQSRSPESWSSLSYEQTDDVANSGS